jgi:hypothetical protein
MAEITVEKALSLLSSDKQKDRTDGLAGRFRPNKTFYLYFTNTRQI